MAVVEDDSLFMPPGFRFHPTNEEIITHYLSPKVLNHGFTARAMGEVDLNKFEPWDLPSRAKMGEKEWYFFVQRDRKYPTGTRTNRATESGYWKATGKDKEIHRGSGTLVGMKKTLVFYRGRAPKGEKTNWVMHEFRHEGRAALRNSASDEWVVCRVFHKNTTGPKKSPFLHVNGSQFVRLNSVTDELIDSPPVPPLVDNYYPFDDGFDLKAAMAMPAYFSSMIGVDDININSINPSTPLLDPSFSIGPLVPPSPSSPPFGVHCKAEQFSNQSLLSQDTGVSTDHNTEISSVVSTHGGAAPCEDLDVVPTNLGGGPSDVLDLRHMWRC